MITVLKTLFWLIAWPYNNWIRQYPTVKRGLCEAWCGHKGFVHLLYAPLNIEDHLLARKRVLMIGFGVSPILTDGRGYYCADCRARIILKALEFASEYRAGNIARQEEGVAALAAMGAFKASEEDAKAILAGHRPDKKKKPKPRRRRRPPIKVKTRRAPSKLNLEAITPLFDMSSNGSPEVFSVLKGEEVPKKKSRRKKRQRAAAKK